MLRAVMRDACKPRRASKNGLGSPCATGSENVFVVIDPATDEILGRYPVGRCQGNHGMTLDPEHHRAFLVCEGNDLMTAFISNKTGQLLPFPFPRVVMLSSSMPA